MKKNVLKTCGLAVLFCLFAFVGSLSAQTTVNKTEVFKVQNGNGDYTWTVPTELDGIPITVTNIRFEAIGAGGAGGYVYDHQGGEAASGGGGGGAYAYLEVANPQETSYTIHVGKGGTSTASEGGSTNVDGDFSSVSGSNGIILKAAGGKTVVPTNHGTVSINYYTKAGAEGGKIADCIPQANATAGGNGSDGDYGLLWTVSGDGGYAAGPADLAGDGGHTSNQSYILSDGKSGNIGFNYGGGGSGAQAYSVRFGNNIECNGGAGADGVVRVTYAYEINANVQTEDATASVCSDENFELPLNITLTNLTYNDITFGFDEPLFVSNYVTRDGTFSIDENFVLKGKLHNVATEAKPYELTVTILTNDQDPTVLATLVVNFTVYAPLTVGTLSYDISSCINVSNILIAMSEATGGSGDYTYGWLDDNNPVSGANGLNYSPSETGVHYISGVANDAVCGTADTTDQMYLQITAGVNSIDPGTMGKENVEVCPNEDYRVELWAKEFTGVAVAYIWQKNVDNAGWVNTNARPRRNYDRTLDADDYTESVSYRYCVKIQGCDSIPCNDVFTVTKKELPDYADQFEEVTITLPYGACAFNIDSLKAPELPATEVDTVYLAEDQEKNLVPSETPYKVVWNVVDAECGAITPDTQLVTVKFPVCGEGFFAEDAENNEYATVRIGCDCWMAENLRTSAANSSYFEEDASYADFGMLYPLADVFPPVRAIAAEDAPVQGICPEGWAVPTFAQFDAMMEAAGSDESVKAEEGWLPEYVGTNESGFSAMAPGFYNASADQFQKHLTFAGFWTSTRPTVDGTGMIFEINYNCENGTPSNAPEANKYSVRCVKVNIDEE